MATFADHLPGGDHASRPSASAVPEGSLYSCTDHDLIYQSDGVSSWATWATLGGGGGATVTTVDATLGGDVTMTNANTFYDGPSASFAAGTWLVLWQVTAYPASGTGQTQDITAKLWDGTTVHGESSQAFPANTSSATLALHTGGAAVVTLGGTTTLKVSVASIRAGGSIRRNVPDNSASSNTATRMVGYKVV